MKVEYQKRFLKELAKVPSKTRKDIEEFVFNELPNSGIFMKLEKLRR